jgi:NNP family nitrate/nitrite transporter-like MFS transporter
MTSLSPARKSQVLLLGIVTSIFFFNFLSRVILAPLLPVIETDLGLDHTTSGGFFMMIALGYSAGLLGSGFVSARLTHRRTIALTAVACGCAYFLIAAGQTLWMIRLGLIFVGIATGIYLPSGITTITSSISPAHWGKAIGVHELAPSLAYVGAPLIVEALLVLFPWQAILALIGGVSVLLGLGFLRLSPGGNFTGEAPTLGNIRILTGKPAFWIMAALFCVGITASMGVYSMMPLYLVAERGFDRSVANTLVGLSRIPIIFMALVSGWLSDRIGPKPMIAAVIFFNGVTAILLGALPDRWVVLMVFLQPMLTVCFFPAAFTILSQIVPQRARNLSVSLTVFIAYLAGAGFVPTILGIFGDRDAFGLAFILIGCLTLLSALLLLRLNIPEKRQDAATEGKRH